MGLFQKEIQIVEQPKQNDNIHTIKLKSLNGYDAMI